ARLCARVKRSRASVSRRRRRSKKLCASQDFIWASREAWQCKGDEQSRNALSQRDRSAKERQPCQELVRKSNRPQQCGSTRESQASRRSNSSRRRPSRRETSVLHADMRNAPQIVREFCLWALFCNS